MKKTFGVVLLPFAWLLFLEVFGLIGIVLLPQLRSRDYLPHPFSSSSPTHQAQLTQRAFIDYDPNLGWYPEREALSGRQRKPLPEKEPNEFRVVTVGGSTMEGSGVLRYEESIAGRIGYHLQSLPAFKGKKITVINEAVSGFYSKQELLALSIKVFPFATVDAVLALDGVNDFLAHALERSHIGSDFSKTWHFREVQQFLSTHAVSTPRGAFLNALSWGLSWYLRYTWSGIFMDEVVARTGKSNRRASDRLLLGNPKLEPTYPVPLPAIRYYVKNIELMDSLSRGQGANFIWFPQPLLFSKKVRSPEESEIYSRRSQRFWDHFSSYLTDVRSMRKGILSQKVRVKDLTNIFDDFSGQAYVDEVHYTAQAQDRIARAMALALAENFGPKKN